jgi:hypothetical protein
MPLDANALKARLAALKTSNTSTFLWKPKPGKKYKIRIVPYKFDRNNPFRELYFHYGLGKKSYLSPVTHGKPDPIMEFAEQLRLSGDKNDFALARKMEPKLRTYVPIIVRGEEDQGVKFWGFGKIVYQRLLTLMTDNDLAGDLSDPIKGSDIIVEYIDPKDSKMSFAKTEIEVCRNSSPLSTDKEQLLKFIDSQKNIFEIFKEYTYDELKVILDNYTNGVDETQQAAPKSKENEKSLSAEELVEEAEEVAPAPEKTKTSEAKSTSQKKAPIKDSVSTDDLSAEFEAMFSQVEKS